MDGNITITNASAVVNSASNDATATVCYEWELPSIPRTMYFMIRPEDDTSVWHRVDIGGEYAASGNNCADITELVAGETYIVHVEANLVGDDKFVSQDYTLPIPEASQDQNFTCDNLSYLVELICQAVTALYNGAKEIYANDCTKERCDPQSLTPTTLTLWSRALRFFHAAKCIACDMGSINLPNGAEDQYYVGGGTKWTTLLQQVIPNTDVESWKLVQSGAIKQYINDKIKEVWHFSGNVDYILDNLASVPADATSVLNLSDDKVYKKSGNSWIVATDIEQHTNFGAYSVKNSSNTTELGKIHQGDMYYYFEGTWNLLNLNTDWIEQVIGSIKTMQDKVVQTPNTGRTNLYVESEENVDCSKYPDGEHSIVFITQNPHSSDKTYNIFFFNEGDTTSTPILPHQIVREGRLIQEPLNPRRANYLFTGWKDGEGNIFDFSTPVSGENTVIEVYATWAPSPGATGGGEVYTDAIDLIYSDDHRKITVSRATPVYTDMIIRVGLTPNGKELGEGRSTGTSHFLTVPVKTHEIDPDYPPILYLQSFVIESNGQYNPEKANYTSQHLYLNPILGIMRDKCNSTKVSYITDIIEKKSNGSCTPLWQGDKRILRKNKCGDATYLLQENGYYLLQENGGKIIIEE